MLELGIIEPSDSSWSSPLHMVPKGTDDWRPCGDYRSLNRITTPDRYPIPHLQDFAMQLITTTIMVIIIIVIMIWIMIITVEMLTWFETVNLVYCDRVFLHICLFLDKLLPTPTIYMFVYSSTNIARGFRKTNLDIVFLWNTYKCSD